MKELSVLIPNRFTWDAVCLTVESILKRTEYAPGYRVIVADNSLAVNATVCEPHERATLDGDDGNRREYLRGMAEYGKIKLIENTGQRHLYGHGENIRMLLGACETPLALLFVSTAEILRPDWLSVLAWRIDSPEVIGVARYRPGGVHFDNAFRMPVYWPNIMLLDMEKYHRFARGDDWDLMQVPFSRFHRTAAFEGLEIPEDAAPDPLVFCDTGWRFCERIEHENPTGYKVLPLPDGYYTNWLHLYGGIDRNSHRPHIHYVQRRLEAISDRLTRLRSE